MTKRRLKTLLYFLTILIVSFTSSSCEKKHLDNQEYDIKKQADEKSKTENDLGNNKSTRASPPATATAKIGETTVTIEYSQPSVKGREVWGELVPYNKVWRTGANEATTISFDKDVIIEGNSLQAGKYALFTIPKKDSDWVIIFNKETSQWGAFNYKEKQDALKVLSKPQSSEEVIEKLTFSIDKTGTVTLFWDKLKVSFNIK